MGVLNEKFEWQEVTSALLDFTGSTRSQMIGFTPKAVNQKALDAYPDYWKFKINPFLVGKKYLTGNQKVFRHLLYDDLYPEAKKEGVAIRTVWFCSPETRKVARCMITIIQHADGDFLLHIVAKEPDRPLIVNLDGKFETPLGNTLKLEDLDIYDAWLGGDSYRDIAESLNVEEYTVRNRLKSLAKQGGFDSIQDLKAYMWSGMREEHFMDGSHFFPGYIDNLKGCTAKSRNQS